MRHSDYYCKGCDEIRPHRLVVNGTEGKCWECGTSNAVPEPPPKVCIQIHGVVGGLSPLVGPFDSGIDAYLWMGKHPEYSGHEFRIVRLTNPEEANL
jgi:hypothetical protein